MSLSKSERARKTWLDPTIRAKRIAGMKRAVETAALRGRPVFLNGRKRLAICCETAMLEELRKVAKAKKYNVASIVRAYIEAGLYADQEFLK